MKKLFLLTIILCSLLIKCESNSETLVDEKKDLLTTQKRVEKTEETPLIRKVSATFNKIVQNKEVFKKIRDLVYEDNIIFKNTYVFEDYFIMSASIIKDDVLPKNKVTFGDVFTEKFNELYSEEKTTYSSILKKLPKLHFGIPVSAIENYESWEKSGFPITVKSYNADGNELQKITKEEVIKTIGVKNYEKIQQGYESFYTYKNDVVIAIIAAKENSGNVIIINEKETQIASFNINNEKHYNSISIHNNNETYTIPQNNIFSQTYIDLPNGCNDFYTFICGSQQMDNHYIQMQQQANETCTTLWSCIPCCNPYTGYVTYYTTLFEPTSIKCKKVQNFVNVLSMYSLTNTPL